VNIDEQQASVILAALDKAIAVVEDLTKRKGAQVAPYKGALNIELSAYKAERMRISLAFPKAAS
jgi:hypothetical protein